MERLKNRAVWWMKLEEVATRANVCWATIRNWIRRGLFPAGVKLGPKKVRWPSDQVDRYLIAMGKLVTN